MKNIPKSKLGAVIAVLYLILVGYFILVFAFGSGGPHGEAGTALSNAFLLILPLSGILISIYETVAQPNSLFYFLFIVGLAVCALINAAALYLIGWLTTRSREALFTSSVRRLK